MLEVDMMSLINMVFWWLRIHYFISTIVFISIATLSTVNLTLFNILEICQQDTWAQHRHNNNTVPCMGNKMHTN